MSIIRVMSLSPSKILNSYYIATFMLGALFTLPTAHWVADKEIGLRGALGLILCWNVLFIMLLPLVLDFLERRLMKARFLQIEEIKESNPELALALDQQCQKLAIPGLKLAITDCHSKEVFSYGLWGANARLMVPSELLERDCKSEVLPSIEAELSKFTRRNHNVIYLIFAGFQAVILSLVLASMIN
ncbi:MAG: hypothetical protein H6677_07425 [Candidatus Obscuribacterales bacterium]|nr:hypothetical protein [Cyanobacteria bacterium HKST-UBA01]MCB9468095.1 hypothetical protein [Candidatus Obscuribacterales bacterium]